MKKLNLNKLLTIIFLYLFAFEASTSLAAEDTVAKNEEARSFQRNGGGIMFTSSVASKEVRHEEDGDAITENGDKYLGIPMRELIMQFHRDQRSSRGKTTKNAKKNVVPAAQDKRQLGAKEQEDLRHKSFSKDGGPRGDIRLLREFYQKRRNLDSTQEEEAQPPSNEDANSGEETLLDAIIVGAGWAGIAAGMTLESKGITNFKVLEASDRIGGRSHTITHNMDGVDYAMDYGSMWIMNGRDNPLQKIVRVLGNIPSTRSRFWSQLYKPDNKGPFSYAQYYSFYDDYQDFYQFQENRQYSTDKDEPLSDSVKMFLDELQVKIDALPPSRHTRYRLQAQKKFISNYIVKSYSATLEQLSLWYWNYGCLFQVSPYWLLRFHYSDSCGGWSTSLSNANSTRNA